MPKKLTNIDFIKKANNIHNNKYDYSKTDYKSYNQKVIIICPIHGEFEQSPSNHLNGQGCPKCKHRSTRKTTQEFIEDAKEIHGDKYDYSKVEYINNKIKVCIICPIHGEFYQIPTVHINNKSGCPKCNNKVIDIKHSLMTLSEFIQKANLKHDNKYDYSKVKYKGSNKKIDIICPIHGLFQQKPNNHLQGQGCPQCGKIKSTTKLTTEEFIQKANLKHNNRYDYSKTNYINSATKIVIICKKHGEFEQTPHNHLKGQNCPKCAKEELRQRQQKSTSIFINEVNTIHNNKYDYSKVEYINNKTKIEIICPIHGTFKQIPSDHLRGKGCPHCKTSKLENELAQFLQEYFNIERQKKFKWLKNQSIDIFISNINVAIECQGEQHFMPIDFANKGEEWAENNFKRIKELDENKKILCEIHNIKLLYFGKEQYNSEIITDEEALLNEIKKIVC